VRVALDGESRTIDLGRASYRAPDGKPRESYFANIASAGMSGAVAKRTNETTKAPFGGKVAYLWSTVVVFAGWRNAVVNVTVDGEVRSGPMFDVIVANGRYLAGGMKIAPEAEPDDGLLDVLLIGDVSKLDLALTMPKIYRGTHLPHPRAELLRGASVTVEAGEPLPVEVDGEQPGTTPVQFDVVPSALRLRVPA
jgi:diacylglycerol kinase family enzyme